MYYFCIYYCHFSLVLCFFSLQKKSNGIFTVSAGDLLGLFKALIMDSFSICFHHYSQGYKEEQLKDKNI